MTLLPIDPAQYPTDLPPMDESITYKVMISKMDIAGKQDKNGNNYLTMSVEVVEPAGFQGDVIVDNYIGLPTPITADMEDGARRAAMKSGNKLAIISKCFGLKTGPSGFDTDSAIGKIGNITVKNDEYQGRKIPRVDKYLF